MDNITRRWTAQDEATLHELLRRRDEIMAANTEPVRAIVSTIIGALDGAEVSSGLDAFREAWTDKLIAHASELVRALQPFIEAQGIATAQRSLRSVSLPGS